MECVVLPFGGSWGRGERILCLWFAWFYMEILWVGSTVKGFPSDVCRVLVFECRLERDFRVLNSRYRIFSVFRERILCVRVSMRLVEFLVF